MAVPVAGTRAFPTESTRAVELIPTTFSVFVRFVVSAKISTMYRSEIGMNREKRAFNSKTAGARKVFRPTYSGR